MATPDSVEPFETKYVVLVKVGNDWLLTSPIERDTPTDALKHIDFYHNHEHRRKDQEYRVLKIVTYHEVIEEVSLKGFKS